MTHKKFSELRAKMSPEAQARAQSRADQMMREMPLAELRRARELTQQQLATILDVNQAWISKVERQTDMYLSTLRSYIQAAGGNLEITARFHDGSISLNNLGDVGPADADKKVVEPASASRAQNSNARELQDLKVNVWTPESRADVLHEPTERVARVWSTWKQNTSGYRTSKTSRATSKVA